MAHIAIAGSVTVHVLLYKRNVGTSISWMGIAWLSPFLGGLLYYAMGVNRVKRRALRLRRERSHMFLVDEVAPDAPDAGPLTPLEYAIGRLTGLSAEPGNRIEPDPQRRQRLSGDARRDRCGREERRAGSYIFRDDAAGLPFIEALIRAHRRGVEVRVLIDGIGGGYFWSGTYQRLREAGVPVDRFLHSYVPWKTPFLNLRNHRKLLVIDGRIAFTGGINIGAENLLATNPAHPVRDTHFRLEGPVVEQLTEAFADDWLYETGEKLLDEAWFPDLHPVGEADRARGHVGARRGPRADRVRDAARHLLRAPLDPRGDAVLPAARHADHGAQPRGDARRHRRHRGAGAFQPHDPRLGAAGAAAHPARSRLPGLAAAAAVRPFQADEIDDAWSLIGSANWDTRSFRLNFELNVEIQDEAFARTLAGGGPERPAAYPGRSRKRVACQPAARQRRPPAAAVSLRLVFAGTAPLRDAHVMR